MNKKIFLTLMIFTLTLTACASNSLTPAAGSNGTSSANALPAQTQLILGTLKLEDTEYAVTSEQAAELLPMWYVLQELTSNDTAAQEEIDGLTSQIQETMTDDQTKAIADMDLGPQDMMAVMQVNGGGTSGTSNTSQTGSTFSGTGGDAGGPPDMGDGFPGGGMPGMAPSGTSSTRTDSATVNQSAVRGTPSALFDAVIELLKAKIK